jgi:hypothetical protein
VIGALVDDTKAHILQHRHALRERDRTAAAQHFEAGAGCSGAGVAIKLNAQRMFGGQPLDGRDIGKRQRRRIDLAIVYQEGAAIGRT